MFPDWPVLAQAGPGTADARPVRPLPDITVSVPRPVIRGLGIAVFLGVFFAAARMIDPFSSSATTVNLGAKRPAPAQAPTASVRTVPALIGTLIGVDYSLEIFVTPEGLRYTVRDREGRLLAEQIGDDEVYEKFPSLDITTMHADVETEMLLVPEE
jgi:hypothetical protein